MKKYFCLVVLSGLLSIPSFAKEVAISTLGISFNLPDNWKYEKHSQQGSASILIAPINDDNPNSANRCRIDVHDLPAHFKSYTQDQLNSAYASRPLTNASFAERLSQVVGHSVTVVQTGQGMLGKNFAYWATSTSSESIGPTTAYFFTKNYLTQSPKYAWNIQCGTASTTTASDAANGFNSNALTFDAFFSSLRITE